MVHVHDATTDAAEQGCYFNNNNNMSSSFYISSSIALHESGGLIDEQHAPQCPRKITSTTQQRVIKCWLLLSGTCYILLLFPALAAALMGAMLFDDPNLSGVQLTMTTLIFVLILLFPIVLVGSLLVMYRRYAVNDIPEAGRASLLPLLWTVVIAVTWGVLIACA